MIGNDSRRVLPFISAAFLLVVSAARADQAAPTKNVSAEQVSAAVEKAHEVLWSKFIGDDGLIHDYVGELPNPEECRLGRPNAIGWWSPIENGPMFTGTYLAAICQRACRSGAMADREEARRLAKGLLACASVSLCTAWSVDVAAGSLPAWKANETCGTRRDDDFFDPFATVASRS